MNNKVCILNYGSGNVKSVFNILSNLSDNVKISNQVEDIRNSTHIVLPGVGAFGSSMEKIKKNIPLKELTHQVIENKKPFLGICVGMQVLADKGFEFGEHQGLGWISGTVDKLDSGNLPLPHIGWNNINTINPNPLLQGLNDNQDFYFVHSYVFKNANNQNIVAQTDYGQSFSSIICQDNIYGVQFHPEKSQTAGKLLLKNFLEIK